jgi:hypothetical protein
MFRRLQHLPAASPPTHLPFQLHLTTSYPSRSCPFGIWHFDPAIAHYFSPTSYPHLPTRDLHFFPIRCHSGVPPTHLPLTHRSLHRPCLHTPHHTHQTRRIGGRTWPLHPSGPGLLHPHPSSSGLRRTRLPASSHTPLFRSRLPPTSHLFLSTQLSALGTSAWPRLVPCPSLRTRPHPRTRLFSPLRHFWLSSSLCHFFFRP